MFWIFLQLNFFRSNLQSLICLVNFNIPTPHPPNHKMVIFSKRTSNKQRKTSHFHAYTWRELIGAETWVRQVWTKTATSPRDVQSANLKENILQICPCELGQILRSAISHEYKNLDRNTSDTSTKLFMIFPPATKSARNQIIFPLRRPECFWFITSPEYLIISKRSTCTQEGGQKNLRRQKWMGTKLDEDKITEV